MDCLTNLIGVKESCNADTAEYWVNDLSGISNDSLAKALQKENSSLNEMVSDTIKFASKYVSNIMLTEMRPKIKGKSVLDSGTFGSFKNAVTVATMQGDLDGIVITLGSSPYHALDIGSVSIKCQDGTDGSISVWDLNQGKELKSVAVTAVAGEIVTVDIDYSTTGREQNIFIGTDVNYYRAVQAGCSSCNNYSWRKGNLLLQTKSVTGTKFESNLSTLQWLPFTLNYSVRCNLEPFVCNNKYALAMAVLYRTGYELIGKMKYTKQLNELRLFEGDHDELRDEYKDEFMKALGAALNHFDVPNDPCFSCGSRVKIKVALP